MHLSFRLVACATLIAVLGSCSDRSLLDPETATPVALRAAASHQPAVRFSELHYDNSGTDADEAIEISAPAGTDLAGWSVVLYNGSNGLVYSTTTLSGVIAESCSGRGVLVVTYPPNGIQNGAPDAMALVDAGGNVAEFLSYEGALTAVDGPAAGTTATDIGVMEISSTPIGYSLQRNGTGGWDAPAASTFGTCNDEEGDEPPPPPPPVTGTFISEIHYDNTSSDVGEAIEIESDAGTDLTGWSVVLYNGSNGSVYGTRTLSGTVADLCDGRGVVVLEYPSNGIQNGNPDAVALVDATGTVVEFISYGGTLTAVGGPADGSTSVDIGVRESSSTPVGHSLQRTSAGWQAPQLATFGACNAGGPPPPPPPPPVTGDVVITELMGDPANAESASWGEWFEVHNRGTSAVDLQGWTIASGGSNQPDHVISASVIVPAGGYVVLGRGADTNRNGGVTLAYNYFTGSSTTIWLDSSDWLVLRDGSGVTVDSVRWANLSRGATKAVRNVASDNTNVDGANWGFSTTTFGAGDYGTPGAPNGTLSDTPPAVRTISFAGRSSSNPALPVGFEDQLFATLRDELGNVVATTFTWTSQTPAIASVDQNGVVRALSAGTAVVRATAPDGTTATYSLPTHTATASGAASYIGNAEFGEPTDADPSDDFIIRRAQFTASYSSTRGTPNWVSYNLEATHFGPEDRCDCFTHDPELPGSYTQLSTADYTGAGAHHGYGIDRGHLARSADRTAGSLDNAVTYYFSNIVPQAADNNQGPWAAFENYLGDRARAGGEEIYIVTGVAGSIGTVKDEGRIVIPSAVWKAALILPRNDGLDDIESWQEVEVVAVLMPNVAGIRDTPWQSYVTTVDAIEQASGYDLFALLRDDIERIIESGTRAPVARTNGPWSGMEDASIPLSAASSTDPDGDALTFSWSFGDGTQANGTSVTHTWADAGTYNVRLIATDVYGAADTTFATATVITKQAAVQQLAAHVAELGDIALARGEIVSLTSKLDAAAAQLGRGNETAAAGQLGAFINQLNALVRSGRLDREVAGPLETEARRIIDALE